MGAASLEAAFSEYDQQPAYLGRGGLLDRDEFAVVCKAMGFSARAEVIFRSLDKDRSGEIAYLLGISLVSPWLSTSRDTVSRSGEIGYQELTEAIEVEGCVLL